MTAQHFLENLIRSTFKGPKNSNNKPRQSLLQSKTLFINLLNRSWQGLINGMVTTQNKHTSKQKNQPHWYYYSLTIFCAFAVALDCAVVSYTFMYQQSTLVLALICATASFALNLQLFWQNKAQLWQSFAQQIQKNPQSVLTWEGFLCACSSICMACLTWESYLDHHRYLSTWQKRVLPYHSSAFILSLASAVAIFALFYEPTQPKPAKTLGQDHNGINKGIMTHLNKAYNLWQRQSQLTLRAHLQKVQPSLAKIIAAVTASIQSSAYTLLNFSCVHSTLQATLLPSTLSTIISAVAAAGLGVSELKFNYNVMKSLADKISTTTSIRTVITHLSQQNSTRWLKQAVLYTAILLNSSANGWIALGNFTGLPFWASRTIISNGAMISYAVMLDSNQDSSFRNYLPADSLGRWQTITGLASAMLTALLGYLSFHPGAALWAANYKWPSRVALGVVTTRLTAPLLSQAIKVLPMPAKNNCHFRQAVLPPAIVNWLKPYCSGTF